MGWDESVPFIGAFEATSMFNYKCLMFNGLG